MKTWAKQFLITGLFAALLAPNAHAESQGNEYKGITDPFGDPANYEFAEDEKEDKEFFHLGRFLMVGADAGVAIFTGSLGKTNTPGPYVGLKILYFFDKSLALEGAVHYSHHLDHVVPQAGQFVDIDTSIIPLTGGFRFYFDTKNAPKAIAIANPYLAFGGGVYIRMQDAISNSQGVTLPGGNSATTSNFGGYGGGGVEFPIYHRHMFLGIDMRFHYVIFSDEDTKLGNQDRDGDYFTSNLSLTYNF